MLVHVTRFTSVQAEVKRQVEEEMRRITRRLRLGEGAGTDTIMSNSRQFWEDDFVVATEDVIEETEDPVITILSWEDLETHIPQAAEDIRVMAINGTSGDVLAYESSRETGTSM